MFKTKQFLIDYFGSPEGLRSFVGAYAADFPGAPTVQKWFQRESIPTGWALRLLGYLELEHGGPVSLRKYLEG